MNISPDNENAQELLRLLRRYCAWCNRWYLKYNDKVMYISHSEKVTDISHGICPKCLEEQKKMVVS